MPRDFGDPNPSDIGDVKPLAPTIDFNETNTRRIGTPDTRITPIPPTFDERVNIQEQFQSIRHIWAGTILEDLGNGLYDVILQNGNNITAIDLYTIPNYAYIEAQTVAIIAGQRAGTYQIIGQKFPNHPSVEFVSLTEILEVGSKAKGKVMLSLGDAGWEITEDEVTVYDNFYQNYGLITEVFPYTYNIATQTATIVGSKGIRRLGTATGSITAGGSGDIQIYDKNGAVTDAIVTAHLTWMHNNQNLTNGKQVFIEWFIEHDKWIIVGREC